MPASLKAITPKKLLNTRKLSKDLRSVGEKNARRAINDLKKPTRTWDTKPFFYYSVIQYAGSLEVVAGTDNLIYGFVSRGTKPHIIRPKRARVLRFQGGYSAKSSPGSLTARKGGASGGFFAAKEVHHPGTKPRYFEETVAAKNQPLFEKEVATVIRQHVEGTYE